MPEKEYIEREVRYIDANSIKYQERTECFGHGHYETIKVVAKEEIDKIPTADVAEVVYCKNCKHRDNKGVCEKFRQRYPFFPEDNFYCGFGERSANNGTL